MYLSSGQTTSNLIKRIVKFVRSNRITRAGKRVGQTKYPISNYAKSFGKSDRKKISKSAYLKVKNILVFILIILTLTITIYFFLTKILVVKTIDCVEQGNVCDEEITTTLLTVKEKSIYKSKSYLSEKLKKEKKLQSFKINIIFPNRLEVNIFGREAKVGLKNQSNAWITEVDGEGVVTEISENSTLPEIETEEPLKNVGDQVDDKTRLAIKIFLGINKSNEIEKGRMSNNLLLIKLKNETISFVFPLNGDELYLVGAFNLILSRLNNNDKETTIEKSEISEIDFRFKYPVIRRIKTFDF